MICQIVQIIWEIKDHPSNGRTSQLSIPNQNYLSFIYIYFHSSSSTPITDYTGSVVMLLEVVVMDSILYIMSSAINTFLTWLIFLVLKQIVPLKRCTHRTMILCNGAIDSHQKE